MTGQAKQLKAMWDEAALVVGDQGRQKSVVVLVTHSAPMMAVVHPVVVVVHPAPTVDGVVHSAQPVVVVAHSAQTVDAVVHSATVFVVVHSADESEYKSPLKGTPPNSHTGPGPAETC